MTDRQPSSRGLSARLPLWGGRTTVQRVELYTVGSLYFLYWFLALLWAMSAAAEAGTTAYGLGILGGTVVLGYAGMLLLRAVLRHRIEDGPPPTRQLVVLVALSAVAEALVFLVPQDARFGTALLVLGTLTWCAGGTPDKRVQTGLYVAAPLLAFLPTGEPFAALGGLAVGLFFVFTAQSSFWLLGVVTELDRARGTQAALAVAEERLRFSRDVHDVLGRRLSTIAVQAELAATLSARGDQRAAATILQVRETAHEGLREARELARGYRPLDLTSELDGAVSLLASAGIAAHADLDGLPREWHEPAARVVREAVTNVLRHSEATLVEIGYDGSELTVANDGVTAVAGSGDGTGLAALREHLEPLGATLAADREGDRFVVRARLAGEPR